MEQQENETNPQKNGLVGSTGGDFGQPFGNEGS